MVYHNYLLIIGRVCGEDNDTAMQYEHMTRDQAVHEFKCAMQALYPDTDWALAEANGDGVYIEFVAASDTPITML